MDPAGHLQLDRPRIGVTLGDPGGIGAEVIVKALADESLRRRGQFIIYGFHEPVAYAADLAELTSFWHRRPLDEARSLTADVVLADLDESPEESRPLRRPCAEGGRASMRFIDAAIDDLRAGRIDAVVTGPINKTAWHMAGIEFPGHTEYLARRFRARRVCMMFVGGPLRVALASTHEALFDLRNSFTIGLVFQPIDLMHAALRDWFAIPEPRIAVAGLNPHAGENGRFGDEEARVIEPAIDMARQHGINAVGPFPADTIFRRAAEDEFDGVVAMYHDQGLIPVKLLAFDRAVNITLGLPIIRTSVDHGTAFDIAGKNRADPDSMKAAIRLAVDLARSRSRRPVPVEDVSLNHPTTPD